MKKRSRN